MFYHWRLGFSNHCWSSLELDNCPVSFMQQLWANLSFEFQVQSDASVALIVFYLFFSISFCIFSVLAMYGKISAR